MWVVMLTENELWGRVCMAITCRLDQGTKGKLLLFTFTVYRLVEREAVHRHSDAFFFIVHLVCKYMYVPSLPPDSPSLVSVLVSGRRP